MTTRALDVHIVVAATLDGGIGVAGGLPWRLPADMAYFRRLSTFYLRTPNSLAYPSSLTGTDATPAPDLSGPERNAVIMGRRTWESIPVKFRPLPHRINIVLTRGDDSVRQGILAASTPESPVYVWSDLDSALEGISAIECPPVGSIWAIGGAELYRTTLASPRCKTIFLTRVELAKDESVADPKGTITCDTFFPEIPTDTFVLVDDARTVKLLGPGAPLGEQTDRNFRFRFLIYERRPSHAKEP